MFICAPAYAATQESEKTYIRTDAAAAATLGFLLVWMGWLAGGGSAANGMVASPATIIYVGLGLVVLGFLVQIFVPYKGSKYVPMAGGSGYPDFSDFNSPAQQLWLEHPNPSQEELDRMLKEHGSKP
jgi:hypothetical protein